MDIPEYSVIPGNAGNRSALSESSRKPESSKSDSSVAGAGSGYKILVVDDEPVLLQLIKNYLRYHDYDVVTASNGSEAVRLINEQKDFDLVILDILMPKMTGYEVCRLIREQYSLFELPVIILTVKNHVSDMIEGFESGANDYISKPFDRQELFARVKTLIKLKRLTHANEILQEAIEIKNQFLNMTIHDLKNPLSVILGITDLLKDEIQPDTNTSDFINLIGESAGLMHNLVNELLDAARIESGKLMLHKEPVDMAVFAREMTEKNKIKAKQKNQRMTFTNLSASSPVILADSVRIHEIIDNLINNAIKYSPLDRDIVVSVDTLNDDKGQNFVRFMVKDQGPGLTFEDRKKIFGKFQRLSAQPTGGESSTGLGLSIVKQLVDLHNGRIYVESVYGQGSTFIVEIPAYVKQKSALSRKRKNKD